MYLKPPYCHHVEELGEHKFTIRITFCENRIIVSLRDDTTKDGIINFPFTTP